MAQVIWAYDFDVDSGTISNRRVLNDTKDHGYPDGATVDAQGCVWSARWEGACVLRIDPKAFSQGVDRVATIATEKTRAVKMALDHDKITLSVTSPENGTAAEEVSGQYSSDSFDIGFNARYLMDILAEIEGDVVELHLADASAPTLIRENDKSAALYVLMPMRV
jgi:hypothetical protein